MSYESSVDGVSEIIKRLIINDDDMSCGSSVDGASDTEHVDTVGVENGEILSDPSYDEVAAIRESNDISSDRAKELDINILTLADDENITSNKSLTFLDGENEHGTGTVSEIKCGALINTHCAIDGCVKDESMIKTGNQFDRYLLATNNESDSNTNANPACTKSLKSANKLDASINTSGEEDAEFAFIQPVRRSTSLKTGRSTADRATGPKKAVRFADALGLDLASVRHIVNGDEPPNVPRSATKDLFLADDYFERVSSASLRFMDVFQLCLCFAQPGASPEFMRRVQERRVALESCEVRESSRVISGIVRVANIVYEKKVAVRWTVNAWFTYTDCVASYQESSKDGRSDAFHFSITLPEHFGYGGRLEFSFMYEAGSETFWDSNHGVNYHVECYVKAVIPREEDVEDERQIGPGGRNCFY